MTTDKQKESIETIKNVNKHLSDLLNKLRENDRVFSEQAATIQFVAQQVGDILVEIYVEGKRTPKSLKTILNEVAIKLSGART